MKRGGGKGHGRVGRLRRWAAGWGGVAGLLAVPGWAAAPVLEHLVPSGMARGGSGMVEVVGNVDPWPARVWVEGAGVRFLAGTNTGRFQVEVDADAEPGVRLVRLHNDEGSSDPRFFVVGDGLEVDEVEPNDRPETAQVLDRLPVMVNGRLQPRGDTDGFAVRMAAGQWLEARVDGYRLMSKLDPVLRLVTPEGRPLAWNHDFTSLDPRLVWQSPDDRTVVVQVFAFAYPADAAIRLAGGAGAVYRLHVAVGTEPPDGEVGGEGWEEEPNDSREMAPRRTLPIGVAGTIGQAGDEDRFRFEGKAGETLEVRVAAAVLGSPLDAWVRVEEPGGRQLAYEDDTDGSPDPRLLWRVPEDGEYVVAVGSYVRRGGGAYRYRLTVERVPPRYEVRSEAGAMVIEAGATNTWKFRVTRQGGHTRTIAVDVRGLPEGVRALPATVPDGDGEGSVALVADAGVKAFGGPVRLVANDGEAGGERGVPWMLTSRGLNNGVPQGYTELVSDRTEALWLTVRGGTGAEDGGDEDQEKSVSGRVTASR
ncbi:MAG: PPC domain-containing protein [Verrucomicrobiae bacterium]|nr:PPC domain-containing protein [Verrucomicrobiae bacterium]